MQIFILDKNIKKCARMHDDKRLNKAILESSQMLANAFSLKDLKSAPKTIKGTFRKHSFLHHPCSKWVLESRKNFEWLLYLELELLEEYRFRFEKRHFIGDFILWITFNLDKIDLPNKKLTPFAQAMPEKYKNKNPILAYHNYYLEEKLNKNNKWTSRSIPKWIKIKGGNKK